MNGICLGLGGRRAAARRAAALSVEPRLITGPEPSTCLPALLDVDPGRVGGVRDVDARSPRRARARRRSCASRRRWSPPARRPPRRAPSARRRPRRRGARPRARRRSRAGCRAHATLSRPLGSSTGSASITATSPMRTIARACSPSRAPMSMCRSRIVGDLLALLVAQQVDRLLADHAPRRRPRACRSRRAGRRGSARPSRRPRANHR